MRVMGAVVAALLLVGCVQVQDRAEPTPEPWIVTSVQIGENGTLRINYYDLAGRVVDWSVALDEFGGDGGSEARLSAIRCVRQATVGGVLPDCARSLDGLFDGLVE